MDDRFELGPELRLNKWTPLGPKIFQLEPRYYGILTKLRNETGLPMWQIIQQCIDYALAHRDNA